MVGDEVIRSETDKIERFVALGLGRYDAITAVDAGLDWRTVERLVRSGCPLAEVLRMAR